MTALFSIALAAALAAAAPSDPPDAGRAESLTSDVPRSLSAHAKAEKPTRCGLCHTADSWKGARFNHQKTGFKLQGAHAQVSCRDCHAQGFEEAPPRTCKGCHRDPHTGALGQRCVACHEETSWRTSFSADAHQRTNFPLSGRHAAIPCQECHFDQRDRAFSRATVTCVTCHQKDYDRAALTSLDHAAMGFSTDCKACHSPARWRLARFAGHDRCFSLSGGHHASIRCLDCHTSLRGVGGAGACSTNTAACTNCHTHSCARTDGRHAGVPGYQCKDRKCYECHRFSTGD